MKILNNTLKKFPFLFLISVTIILLLETNFLQAQSDNIKKFRYIFPLPSSILNSPETNIIIRFGEAFNNSILNPSELQVVGSETGYHRGKTILAENQRTLIFNPDKKFADGETVTVKLNKNLETISGKEIPDLQYSFQISHVNLNSKKKFDIKNVLLENKQKFEQSTIKQNKLYNTNLKSTFSSWAVQDSLPDDFPEIFVDTLDNPTQGYLFSSPFTYPIVRPTYNIITDNFGTPIYYKKMNFLTFDFKKQLSGVLSYFDTEMVWFYIMDSSYKIIDTLQMQNGNVADLHELLILENGHSLMMDYDLQPYGMDTVVEGGHPNATVIGLVIQELDKNKNVVFQWRSWDHFKITDATFNIDLTDSVEIDYVHGNAIEVDFDGNLLISSRHLDEITKISRETGEIIWRWGGEHCRNNEFTFINDPIGFSHQHDIRRLSNGNLLLFDNGNLHDPPFSRAVEYQLDEENKYAFLVWEYRNEPETFSGFMGSSRRLENHNTFIGWGSGSSPAMTEVSPDNSVKLQLSFSDTVINYRAFKFPWKTNLFVTDPGVLSFYIPAGDSLVKSLTVKNNSGDTVTINRVLNRDSVFTTISSLPVIIPPYDTTSIQVKFSPYTSGIFTDDLHLQWNKEGERIAQVVPLYGTTDSTTLYVDDERGGLDYFLGQNYPNPFNPNTTITFAVPRISYVTIKIFDILGREIKVLLNELKQPGLYEIKFDGSNLSSGTYIYTITADNFHSAKKLLLLK